jgi:two-component system KDP operon response regulator KdpE
MREVTLRFARRPQKRKMEELENVRILIVDDDPVLCQLLKTVLRVEGMEVEAANSGEAGIQVMYRMKPDLVLLDIMMPEVDGWETTQRIRQVANVPIIIISALSRTEDIVRSLESGADDFINKPFEMEELLARIRAVRRRAISFGGPPEYAHDYDDGYLAFNIPARQVYLSGEEIYLSATEYKLFEYLFRHAGRVCPNADLLEHVWGSLMPNGTRYLHVYIWKLRSKIEPETGRPVYFQTEHGTGYRFERQQQVKA